jgi:hypothetical protein
MPESGILEKIESLGGVITSLTSGVSKLTEMISKIPGGSFDKVKEGAVSAGKAIATVTTDTTGYGKALKTLADTGVSSLSLLKGSTINVSESFKQMGTTSSGVLSDMSKHAEIYSGVMSKLGSIIPKSLEIDLGEIGKGMFLQAEAAKKAEVSLYNYMVASGQGATANEQFGASFQNAGNVSKVYSQQIYEMAQAGRVSMDVVTEWASKFREIPGFLNGNIDSLEKTGNSYSRLNAAMNMSRVTGMDMSAVMAKVHFEYERFNGTGDDSLKMLGLIRQSADTLKVPISYMNDIVDESRKAFQDYSDSGDGAIRMINGLGKALDDTGSGPGAMKDILSNVTTAMKGMETGAKSFLSMQTGGAGGLRGAFQIDKLLAEGKTDEVYKKMEAALKKQFGGKIYNLNDAASSDQGAAAYQKQLSFLMEGPFGKLANNVGQAEKLLSAMKAGTSPASVMDKEQVFTGMLGQGDAQAKRYDSLLRDTANKEELRDQTQFRKSFETLRNIMGSGNESLRTIFDETARIAKLSLASGAYKQVVAKSDNQQLAELTVDSYENKAKIGIESVFLALDRGKEAVQQVLEDLGADSAFTKNFDKAGNGLAQLKSFIHKNISTIADGLKDGCDFSKILKTVFANFQAEFSKENSPANKPNIHVEAMRQTTETQAAKPQTSPRETAESASRQDKKTRNSNDVPWELNVKFGEFIVDLRKPDGSSDKIVVPVESDPVTGVNIR